MKKKEFKLDGEITTEKTVRMNSRITIEQKKYIKNEAKKLKISEGQLNRKIIDFYIKKHNK